jgi:ATP-dependent exoDNAse (exonuclease V) beta subunit
LTILSKDNRLVFPHILVIDASAGSGKTETLAQRFIQFLLSNKIKTNDLANILAITFTNNAAREMKQRIIKWLKIIALDPKGDEEKERIYALFSLKPEDIRDRATAAIESVISRYSDFHVQTIDSFMSRILRGSADELGMPPDNDITESYTDLTRQAMDKLFAGFGTVIPYNEIEMFLDLFNISQTSSFSWNPADKIGDKFVEFLIQEGKVLEEIDFSDQTAALNKKHAELHALYQEIRSMGLDGEIRVGITRGLGNGKPGEFDPIEFFGFFDREGCGLTKKGIALLLDTKPGPKLAGQIQKAAADMANLVSLSKYTAYGPMYRRFKGALESIKHWTETIHFDDINKKLSNYVKKELVPEIYYRLGDVLYHFLLDEFQDTDQVQWENLKPLLDETYAKGGTLFAVGDMKQAIFMWRKADYRIMWELVRCIKGELGSECLAASVRDNARVIPLEYNYRSGGKILDYVDSVFKGRLKDLGPKLLTDDRTGLTDYAQKVPENKKPCGYVKNIIIPEADGEPEKDVLIGIVKDVMERYPLQDIAILSYKNVQIESIVSWLTEAGIRAASFSSLNIRKRKIIMEIVNLLQFLDTPIDNLSFAAFITGDIFLKAVRKTDKTITRASMIDMILGKKLSRKSRYLYGYFRDHESFKDLWSKYFARLFGIVGYYPLYDLVAEVYKTFNIFDNFPEETGFLARFLEAIVAMESQGMGDIKDFIDLATEEGTESILDVLLPDYMDAVKAMTFHKAKGLGFSVVINMFYPSGDEPGYVLYDPQEGRLLMRYVTVKMRNCDPRLNDIYLEEALDGRIQTLNTLYVALTRAKNELYNLVIRKVEEEKPAAENPVEEKPGKGKKKNSAPRPEKEKVLMPLDLFDGFETGKKEKSTAAKKYPEPTLVTIPPETVYEFAKDEDKNWSVQRRLESQKGDLYHKILAKIEFVTSDIEPVIADLVKKALASSRITDDPEAIKAALFKFLNKQEVKPWFEKKKGREILREAEFVNDKGALYRMDRVVIDPDRIALIDFKTGGTLDFYAAQLKNYRHILEKVYPGKPVTCYWAYVDSARVEEVS